MLALNMSLICLYGFLFPCSMASITAEASLLASQISSADTMAESSPFGSGSFLTSLKKQYSDIAKYSCYQCNTRFDTASGLASVVMQCNRRF